MIVEENLELDKVKWIGLPYDTRLAILGYLGVTRHGVTHVVNGKIVDDGVTDSDLELVKQKLIETPPPYPDFITHLFTIYGQPVPESEAAPQIGFTATDADAGGSEREAPAIQERVRTIRAPRRGRRRRQIDDGRQLH